MMEKYKEVKEIDINEYLIGITLNNRGEEDENNTSET